MCFDVLTGYSIQRGNFISIFSDELATLKRCWQ
jgi:hypothetical protein